MPSTTNWMNWDTVRSDPQVGALHALVGADVLVAAREGADEQVLLDGELGERPAALGHVGDARAGHLVGPAPAQLAPVEDDVPVRLGEHPADRAQRGRLARAVGPEDR